MLVLLSFRCKFPLPTLTQPLRRVFNEYQQDYALNEHAIVKIEFEYDL